MPEKEVYGMKLVSDLKQHFVHKTRKDVAKKFFIVLTVLALYFIFTVYNFGFKDGFIVMILTWSFFVLATPIPDGGLILDLPIRYFTGIKMMISEIFVWTIAISINVFNLLFNIQIYEKTFLLTIFKDIILNPFPYGAIILLSGLGTFFSLYVGDELYDVLKHEHSERYNKHKEKVKIIILLGIVVFVIMLYELLLKHLGVKFI